MVLLALGSFSCKGHKEEYHVINDKIEALSLPESHDSIFLQGIDEADFVKISENGHEFLIPERKGQVRSYSCTECHNTSLEELKMGSGGKRAHWDIKMNHAQAEIMNCATCHNPENMNTYSSLAGKELDFNLSHKLCAQCHTTQFKDWAGGAHGKKISGWEPPRASMTCVNCHNPHQPAFDSRWPARFNTQILKERKEDLEH